MIRTDEDLLSCDLAETYHIYDYRQLPALQVAVFSYGLHTNSRIKLKMRNEENSFGDILLASINDKLSTLIWFKTKDGQNNRNRPLSLTSMLLGKQEKNENGNLSFNSGKEFDDLRNQILRKEEDV